MINMGVAQASPNYFGKNELNVFFCCSIKESLEASKEREKELLSHINQRFEDISKQLDAAKMKEGHLSDNKESGELIVVTY